MASLINDPGGRRRIQLSQPDGRRSTIRLGKCNKAQASWIKIRIEELDAARRMGVSPGPETAAWLGAVDARLYRRLAAAHLVEPRIVHTVTTLARLSELMLEDLEVAPATRVKHQDTHASLMMHMRRDTPIEAITPDMAQEWRELLEQTYAPATVAKEVQRARQLFLWAIKKRMLESSPFEDVKMGSTRNPARNQYVDLKTAAQVLNACPDARWRLIFSLARFAGVRVPSELFLIRFEDYQPDRNRIMIRSPKGAAFEKPMRDFPLVPQLRTAFEGYFETIPPSKRQPTWSVIKPPGGDITKSNLRTGLTRILKAASIKPWPRLFHNLRASCQTDLEGRFPTHVVCAWLGNSPAVAASHYLMVKQDDFDKASAPSPPQIVQQP